MYGTQRDLREIVAFLNEDEEVAYITSKGPRKWKAVSRIGELSARICIWHVPSGALPLIDAKSNKRTISDPWGGWKEIVPAAARSEPYFGAGWPGVIWLNIRSDGIFAGSVGMSSFEWIGNRYRPEGYPAHPATEKWWKKIGRKVHRLGTKIPRGDGLKPEIWALAEAYGQIVNGRARDMNP